MACGPPSHAGHRLHAGRRHPGRAGLRSSRSQGRFRRALPPDRRRRGCPDPVRGRADAELPRTARRGARRPKAVHMGCDPRLARQHGGGPLDRRPQPAGRRGLRRHPGRHWTDGHHPASAPGAALLAHRLDAALGGHRQRPGRRAAGGAGLRGHHRLAERPSGPGGRPPGHRHPRRHGKRLDRRADHHHRLSPRAGARIHEGADPVRLRHGGLCGNGLGPARKRASGRDRDGARPSPIPGCRRWTSSSVSRSTSRSCWSPASS